MSADFCCPSCGYPSRNGAAECDNPGCLANPSIPETHKVLMRERAAQALAAREKAEAERQFKARLSAAGFTTC